MDWTASSKVILYATIIHRIRPQSFLGRVNDFHGRYRIEMGSRMDRMILRLCAVDAKVGFEAKSLKIKLKC